MGKGKHKILYQDSNYTIRESTKSFNLGESTIKALKNGKYQIMNPIGVCVSMPENGIKSIKEALKRIQTLGYTNENIFLSTKEGINITLSIKYLLSLC